MKHSSITKYEELTSQFNTGCKPELRRFCSIGNVVFGKDHIGMWRWYKCIHPESFDMLESKEAFSNLEHCKRNALRAYQFGDFENYARPVKLELDFTPSESGRFHKWKLKPALDSKNIFGLVLK